VCCDAALFDLFQQAQIEQCAFFESLISAIHQVFELAICIG
jgi:hypothetical protein